VKIVSNCGSIRSPPDEVEKKSRRGDARWKNGLVGKNVGLE
jgi:hypothetical protein